MHIEPGGQQRSRRRRMCCVGVRSCRYSSRESTSPDASARTSNADSIIDNERSPGARLDSSSRTGASADSHCNGSMEQVASAARNPTLKDRGSGSSGADTASARVQARLAVCVGRKANIAGPANSRGKGIAGQASSASHEKITTVFYHPCTFCIFPLFFLSIHEFFDFRVQAVQ